MIEVKNQFARHGMFWFLVLPFFLFLFVPAMVPREEMRVPREEVKMLYLLGQDAAKITAQADEIYQDLFVSTGVVGWSKKLFTSDVKEDDPKFFRNLAKSTLHYQENVWNMVYRAIWRLVGLWPTFMVLMLSVALPSLIDGLVVRAKKVDVFESHNPVFFWSAGHSLVMVVGVFVLLPLLPYPISINILYGSIGAIAITLWITASNFQTGN